MTAIIIVGGLLAIFAFIAGVGYLVDSKSWNKGRCQCGLLWQRFDTDSQGGRGYKCLCGEVIWVSWPVDRNEL